jgi:hypothetical protein
MSLMDTLIDRFTKEAPVAVMTRALFANILAPKELDTLFQDCAEKQYEGELLFSTAVHLLALAVTKQQPALNAAYRQHQDSIDVSVTAIYQKLRGVELPVTRELVRRTAGKMAQVLDSVGWREDPLIPGYETRVLDGFHLRGTEHRIKETRSLRATPLPGQCLAVLDPRRHLLVDIYPCEDGHAQERGILPELVEDLSPGQLWIMDRNFCTKMWLLEIALNKSFFIVRHHANLPLEKRGAPRRVGRIESGEVWEQTAVIRDRFGDELTVRCITLKLNQPTEDGDTEIVLLTNLPSEIAAETIATAYRQRWTIEHAFLELTLSLHGEIDTLTYPPAALLACAIAFVTYNVMSVVKSTIAQVQGPACQETRDNLSMYYLASEVAVVSEGMQIAIPSHEWHQRYAELSAKQMAAALKNHARHVKLKRYLKNRRGPKKPQAKRTGRKSHVSTARLLATRRQRE